MPFDEKIWQRFLAGFSGKIPFYCRALSLGNGLYVKYSPSPHSVVAWYNTAFDEKLFFSEKAPFSAPRSNPPMGRTSVLPIGGFFACGLQITPFDEKIGIGSWLGISFYCRALVEPNGTYIEYCPSAPISCRHRYWHLLTKKSVSGSWLGFREKSHSAAAPRRSAMRSTSSTARRSLGRCVATNNV